MTVREFIKNNILLFDGAMGTMLQNKGLKIGENPEVFGYKNPEKLMEIHRLYLEAGSNIITTNTFGANELKLDKLGYTVEEIVDNAVNMAKKAIENHEYQLIIMDEANIHFQTAELGKVDLGGGGTIAYILGNYNMNVIDAGIPVLNMHAPCEIISKVDIYEAYQAYKVFLKNA